VLAHHRGREGQEGHARQLRERASHVRPPPKRLTRWNCMSWPTQELAMNKKLVAKASTLGELSSRLPSSSRPRRTAAASGRTSFTASRMAAMS
jgi:hypothetical protein